MQRRQLIAQTSGAIMALYVPFDTLFYSKSDLNPDKKAFLHAFPKEWCDGMVLRQIDAPNDDKNSFKISVKSPLATDKDTLLSVPIVSNNQEKITKINDKKLVIQKENAAFVGGF